MTVVATLLLHDIPVVIGDAILTTVEPGATSIEVPTTETLPKLKQPISGFCRKVYIIDKTLAVAWTGSRLEAEEVILALKTHIRHYGVSESNLVDFLSSRIKSGRSLRLIGWFAEHGQPQPR